MRTLFLFLVFSLSLYADPIISVYATRDGEVIADLNSDLSLLPASLMKLVTTGAALQILGPDQKLETTLAYDGKIKGQILQGNIYIVGGGDPTLGSDRFAGIDKVLEEWVEAVSQLGIKTIQGKVIADAGCFDKQMARGSWLYEDLANYYGAGACGLSFHENFYRLTFKPGSAIGEKTTILRIDPSLPLQIENEVLTGAENSGDQACIYGSEYSWKQFVRGTIPLGKEEFTIKGAIPDPAFVCQNLFVEALNRKGITIADKDIKKTERTKFHTTFSPTIAEIVHLTNRHSVNLYAEHLFKLIGEEEVVNFWKTKGVSLQMQDGSGLSRKNLITTKDLVKVLEIMKASEIFVQSLPTHGKTGSMSLVQARAGYVNGTTFAIIVNNSVSAKKGQEVIESYLSKF